MHRNIHDIDIPNYVGKKIEPLKTVKENLCFDLETRFGRGFLIADSNGRYANYKQFNDLCGLLTFLSHRDYRKTINWTYNLGFDTNAILHWLNHDQRSQIAEFNYVDYEDLRIKIIPQKLLSIGKIYTNKDGETQIKNPTNVFDLAQFYNYIPLKELAKQTNYAKVHVDDISAININKYNSNAEYHKLINDRCIIDCKIAKELADILMDNVRKAGININKPLSKASFARRYVLENIKRSLKLPNIRVLDCALKSYHAGFISTNKLGLFKNVENYDLKAAYPSEIANLYDTEGTFIHNQEYEPDTAYSYYLVDVNVINDNLSPLWYIKNGTNYHPTGKMQTWIIQSELEYMINQGYDCEIIQAYHIQKTRLTEKPYENIINDLYNARIEALKDNNKPLAEIFKITANSIYGSQINIIPTFEKIMEETELWDVQTGIDGIEKVQHYREEFTASNMFNPCGAAKTCGNTRMRLFNDFDGQYGDIIAISTDGVFTKIKNSRLTISERMGDYSHKTIPLQINMGSGRYLNMDKSMIVDEEKSRFRSVPMLRTADILDILTDHPTDKSFTISRDKPVKLKESEKSSKLKPYFNQFKNVSKKIQFKSESRYWFDQIKTLSDLLDIDQSFDSRPFEVSEMKKVRVV